MTHDKNLSPVGWYFGPYQRRSQTVLKLRGAITAHES